jgi:lysophospholipase L1-like esterase
MRGYTLGLGCIFGRLAHARVAPVHLLPWPELRQQRHRRPDNGRHARPLHPSVVLIWGGVNDLPKIPIATTESNLEQLYQQSKSAGIAVIACTLTPLRGTSTGFNPDVVEINHWIRSYANAHSIVLADYYPAVVTSDGMLRSDYAIDVVHLNDAGYAAITPIARVAIEAAMGSR